MELITFVTFFTDRCCSTVTFLTYCLHKSGHGFMRCIEHPSIGLRNGPLGTPTAFL